MKKICLLLCLFSFSVLAKEYVVIANKKLQIHKVTREYLKQIYLKKHTYLGEKGLVPVNLAGRSKVRASFEKHVLKMSRNRLKRFWTVEHYKGKRPPLTMQSPNSALKFVEKVEGALAYIPAKMLSKKNAVKVIYTWSDK